MFYVEQLCTDNQPTSTELTPQQTCHIYSQITSQIMYVRRRQRKGWRKKYTNSSWHKLKNRI